MEIDALARYAPSIKTPVQLAGLAFTVLAASLIYRANPDNVQSLAFVGGIGIAVMAIPLAFDKNLLITLPQKQRAWFLILIVGLQLISLAVLATITIAAVRGDDLPGAKIIAPKEHVERDVSINKEPHLESKGDCSPNIVGNVKGPVAICGNLDKKSGEAGK